MEAIRPRLYLSGELLFQGGEGNSGNRLAAGVRTTVASRYQLDLYYHRERAALAREIGARDAMVVQLLVLL